MKWSMKGLPVLIVGAGLVAAPAVAHDLNVFAYVEGAEIVAEAKYGNGNPVTSGSFDVRDGNDELIASVEVGKDGTARFPLGDADGGLRIEMDAGEGHYDYWILTPADIEAQRAP